MCDMPVRDNKAAINILLQTLELNPELWETRKKTAEILFDEEQYVEAAEILWSAPDIPSTDTDIAFTIKIISRAKPNRAIRLIYEMVRRNNGKPAKNMAVASALNDIGMYMQAARFYGAALASDPSLFDLGFEREALWMDDSKRLLEEWQASDHEFKPPLDVPNEEIPGGLITPKEIADDPILSDQLSQPSQPDAVLTHLAAQAPVTQPLTPTSAPMLRRSSPTPSSILPPPPEAPSAAPAPATPATPAPIRFSPATPTMSPSPAQEVPTQPLQPIKPSPAPTQSAPNAAQQEPELPAAKTGTPSGRLLTPIPSGRPAFKFK